LRFFKPLFDYLTSIFFIDSNINIPRIEEPEEAPAYEPPPNYNEIIKVGMNDQMRPKKERRSGRKSRMNRR
jgi:hypothetical protein